MKKETWLDNLEFPKLNKNDANYFPGKDLNFPETGVGSTPSTMRRIIALSIDWSIAIIIVKLLLNPAINWVGMSILVVWLISGMLCLTLFGFTPGQYFSKLKVVFLANNQVLNAIPWKSALLRGILLALVIPGLVSDYNRRGLQDRLTNTAVVISR